jgi:hypothetical protein
MSRVHGMRGEPWALASSRLQLFPIPESNCGLPKAHVAVAQATRVAQQCLPAAQTEQEVSVNSKSTLAHVAYLLMLTASVLAVWLAWMARIALASMTWAG